MTPILLTFNDRVLRPRFGTRVKEERPADTIDHAAQVVIAGFGSYGSTVGRLLRSQGITTVVLDHDSEQVDLLRRLGLEVYYGDATRIDLLETAGIRDAQVLVLALDDPPTTLGLAKAAREHWPHLKIYARAFDWRDATELHHMGVERVYREALDSSLRLGTDVMRSLGVRAYHAERAAQKFLRHDEESLGMLTDVRNEREAFISAARERIESLERILGADLGQTALDQDAGWDPSTLIEEFGGGPPSPDTSPPTER